MAAALYTPDEERRYGLMALPEVGFVGVSGAERLYAAYVAQRRAYRAAHPGFTRSQIARP
jgi:hypothetical protein